MRVIEVNQILELIKGNNLKKTYIPRPVVVRPHPQFSRWFVTYLQNPPVSLSDESHRDGKEFRKLFRIPDGLYGEIVEWVSSWYRSKDCFGRTRIPVGLLVLAALKIIGFGWTLLCCAAEIHVGKETLRRFYNLFLNV